MRARPAIWTSFLGIDSRVFFRNLHVDSSPRSAMESTDHSGAAVLRPSQIQTSTGASGSIRRVKKVTAGVFVTLQFQELALLRFQEQIAKGAEAVGALVEARMLALDGLFHA